MFSETPSSSQLMALFEVFDRPDTSEGFPNAMLLCKLSPCGSDFDQASAQARFNCLHCSRWSCQESRFAILGTSVSLIGNRPRGTGGR